MLNHKRLGASALGLSALLVLTGCAGGDENPDAGDGDTPAEPTHISVSVTHSDGIQGLAWTVGQQEGFFEDHGVIIDEVIPAEGGGTTLQNVIAGDLPFGQVATSALVKAYEKGLPIQIIAGATQAPYEIGWGVLADSEFETVEDLDGATWGFTNPGSVTEAMSYLVPLKAGLDMDSITRVSTGGLGAGIALLEAGEVDTTFVTPLVALDHKEDLRIVINANEVVPYYELTMIVAARDYAQEHPEVAKGTLLGLQDSIDWIKANPEDATEIYAAAVQVDPAAALDIINNYIKFNLWGLAFNPEALDAVAVGLKYTDGIESVDWSGLLTDEFLPEGHKGEIPG